MFHLTHFDAIKAGTTTVREIFSAAADKALADEFYKTYAETTAADLRATAEAGGDAPLTLVAAIAAMTKLVHELSVPGASGYHRRTALDYALSACRTMRNAWGKEAVRRRGGDPSRSVMDQPKSLDKYPTIVPAWKAIALGIGDSARWEIEILCGTWTAPVDDDDSAALGDQPF